MTEYITKEEVRDILARHYPYANLREETAMHHINEDIKALPAADVAEVVHGEYIGTEYDGFADGNPVYYEWICSACGCVFEDEEPAYKYCPNCGAKMDGGDHDAAD